MFNLWKKGHFKGFRNNRQTRRMKYEGGPGRRSSAMQRQRNKAELAGFVLHCTENRDGRYCTGPDCCRVRQNDPVTV